MRWRPRWRWRPCPTRSWAPTAACSSPALTPSGGPVDRCCATPLAVAEFHTRAGILVEATSTPPGMGTMVLPGFGRSLLRELAGADHLATLGAMIADAPSGRVHGRRRAFLRYDLTRRDGMRLMQAL